MPPSIVWFRRDLRLEDHPALHAALEHSDAVVPFFCIDRRLTTGRHRSGSRTQFMLECLHDLDSSLRERGSRLVVRDGVPEHELAKLANQLGAQLVHASADVSPFATRRDERARHTLVEQAGAELVLHPGLFAVDEPTAIVTGGGRPYTVFTPFHRAWLRAPRRSVLAAPDGLPSLPGLRSRLKVGRVPTLQRLGLEQEVESPVRGGEREGRTHVERFLNDHHVRDYGTERDVLGSRGTSALSPFLHFGCVSPREIESRLGRGRGAQEFHRQLCWREFYAQVLHTFPRNSRSEHQQRYRGAIRWSRAIRSFEAWCDGRTGYPVVDAAMRQLRREGWMHNRARLIVGSFLTKDLGIDWRWGERWFMRLLIDGDQANNNGNWQWIASVGVDPQPPARRIYNPSLQQAKFDPDGIYVRRYVSELARVPDEYLAEPWTMPADLQTDVGCVIGRDYPAPIVDHRQARREAIERYAAARG